MWIFKRFTSVQTISCLNDYEKSLVVSDWFLVDLERPNSMTRKGAFHITQVVDTYPKLTLHTFPTSYLTFHAEATQT